MRKLLLSLLLASAAASPALAAPRDNDNREQARAERQAAREERQQAREERQEQAREPRAEVQVAPRAERQVEFRARGNDGPARVEAVGRGDRRDIDTIRAARNERRVERQDLVEQRRENIRENRALRQSERAVPHVLRDRAPIVSSVPREGTQPPLRAESRRSSPVRWSSSQWRNDRRYDWRNWRNRHRSLFNLGFYYDPFGWGYQRYNIGWRMWPSYYQRGFWLSDPWQYRLPYAPPGYRWIRYYDDAILVDTWNGQVVDVIYNFFW